jgi:hypothetical protein
MSTRRSRPPRNRKSRNTEPPRRDVVVTMPPPENPAEDLAQGASPAASSPEDELEALDAGWD